MNWNVFLPFFALHHKKPILYQCQFDLINVIYKLYFHIYIGGCDSAPKLHLEMHEYNLIGAIAYTYGLRPVQGAAARSSLSSYYFKSDSLFTCAVMPRILLLSTSCSPGKFNRLRPRRILCRAFLSPRARAQWSGSLARQFCHKSFIASSSCRCAFANIARSLSSLDEFLCPPRVSSASE